jgi:hypothetical protein
MQNMEFYFQAHSELCLDTGTVCCVYLLVSFNLFVENDIQKKAIKIYFLVFGGMYLLSVLF